MKKQFTAQDCIHLFACRRLNKIANKVCYGEKGTQKIARGCNDNCICYVSSFDDEAIESLAEEIKEYRKSALKPAKREEPEPNELKPIMGELSPF